MKAKNESIFFVTRKFQENWDFKSAQRQQNDLSSGGPTFEGLKVHKGSSSIRKALGYKLSKWQKMTKLAQKKILVSTVSKIVK